jgi:phosphohistidine swiveling domain-containing protein
MSLVEKIYWLLEDCKRYGTLPFAGLARAGFIAVQMLKSMVSSGILAETESAEFMSSLDTVNARMARDYATLPRETFLSVYGHLRPGTYDILSPRYDEAPDRYFDWNRTPEEFRTGSFRLAIDQYARIQSELQRHRLDLDVLGLFEFLKRAIEGREYAKFLFTRNVSDALSLIKRLGRDHGFEPEDLSYVDVRAIQRLFGSCESPRAVLARSIEQGRQAHDVTRALVLPSLIYGPEDVRCFHVLESEPNYVTHLSVEADVAVLDSKRDDLRGKVVFIENADPGFDWIFTKGIAGFVTMYGGVNSHMAIRAAEMKIPAVVGAGESHYRAWSSANRLLVDCCNRQVTILR